MRHLPFTSISKLPEPRENPNFFHDFSHHQPDDGQRENAYLAMPVAFSGFAKHWGE